MIRQTDLAEDPRAERQCLAGLLLAIGTTPQAVRECVAGLEPGAFTDPVCGEIMAAILDALQADPPSIAAVGAAVRRRAIADGSDHANVMGIVAEIINCEYVGPDPILAAKLAAGVVRQAHARRRAVDVMKAGMAALGGARDTSAIGDVIAALKDVYDQAAPVKASNDLIPIESAMDSWARQEKMPMVETGFRWFDDVAGGLPIGLVTGIAAQPDLGKTALCVQLATGALLRDRGLQAVWAAGEGEPEELCDRFACVASSPLGLGQVTRDECEARLPKARKAAKAFVEATYGRLQFLNPERELTIERLDAALEETGARLCVIDYFQLLRGPDAGTSRVDDLDALMDKLKRMAIRRKCAVLLVCEVSKSVNAESRAGQIGRHSAAIDYGCFNLFYGDYADCKPVEDEDGTIGVVWHCKKLKGRRKRNLSLRFDGACQTFYEFTTVQPHDEFNAWPSLGTGALP